MLYATKTLAALGAAAMMALPLAAVGESANAASGRAIYEQNCATCHGMSGKGDGPAAVALNPKPRNFTDAALMATISHETRLKAVKKGGAAVGVSPVMPAFQGVLTPAQIRDVLAYVATFSGGAQKAVAQH